MSSSSPSHANNNPSLSSSPPIPCRPNPKPRNSETGDLMRRSFRANPFPADFPRRRNSIDGGGGGGGDKENHNENVLKSPKVGAKNFMSPTISAVSKINPSPKKKILSDKNQKSRPFDNRTNHQVKSSVSFSDVVSFIGEEDDKDHKRNQLNDDEDDVTVTDLEESHGDFDDSRFFNNGHVLPPSVASPVFVAQEVDSMMAPYDPKKNYLSPRPQFLHYRPNPRIEHRSDECKQLEELFIDESSSSDIDLSTDESQEEEEVASQEDVVAVEEEEEKAEEVTPDVDEEEHLEVDEKEETQQIPKRSRFKFLGLVLALGVAYLVLVSSVTFTQPNISQDSLFYKLHVSEEFIKSARESFEQLGERLEMLAGSSLVYMDKLISNLREEKRHGPFKFHNLTDVSEDTKLFDSVFQTTGGEISVAGGLLVDSQEWSFEMDIEEENVDHQEPEEPENGGGIGLEDVYEEDGNEFEQTENKMATDVEMNGGEGYSESLSEEESGGQETDEGHIEYAENDQKNMEEGHESETISAQHDKKSIEEAESDTQLDAVESDAMGSHQQEEAREVANPETAPPEEERIEETAGNTFDVSEETSDVDGNDLEVDSETGEAVNAVGGEVLLSNQKKAVALISTVMVLLASAVAFFLIAKKKAEPVMMMTHEDDKPIDSKEVKSEQIPAEDLIIERLSSLNFQQKEDVNNDREREVSSFPSEVSFSFRKNKSLRSCSNNKDDLEEYQSGGRGGRKSNDSSESMASSASEYSIGSVSYGSFTTYEKIQNKSGRKEKEIVTPVRRSSRIRNHQHSGQ